VEQPCSSNSGEFKTYHTVSAHLWKNTKQLYDIDSFFNAHAQGWTGLPSIYQPNLGHSAFGRR
jgi:hypothetical protein